MASLVKSQKSTMIQLTALNEWNDEKLKRIGVSKQEDRKKLLDIIDELKSYKQPKPECKVFRDSLYGPIKIHPLLVKIIDTPQFQRLRDIKQLGGVYYVYPGASHNRYEHSIGYVHSVCYLAGVLVESIRDRQPELGITERDVLCVKIAALCHDMGHGPLSHVFQDLFMELTVKHEETSVDLLKHLVESNKLSGEFDKYGLNWEEDRQFIFELIKGKRKKDSQEKSFLYQIVANDVNCVDVDKMDYIARDCHALGITLSFDWKRYMLFCRVIKVNEEDHICIREKEIQNLYELFHIRNYLFRIAYKHKTVRAIEHMINDALMKAKDINITDEIKLSADVTKNMEMFTKLTDSVLCQIKCNSSEELDESRKLLKRVDTRDLYFFIDSKILKSPISDEEGFKAELYKCAGCEGDKELEERIKKGLLIDSVTFHYGKDKHNPINELYFYRKNEPDVGFLIESSQISQMFSCIFEESEYRVYYKPSYKHKDKDTRKVDEDTIEAIRNGFDKACINLGLRQNPQGRQADQSKSQQETTD